MPLVFINLVFIKRIVFVRRQQGESNIRKCIADFYGLTVDLPGQTTQQGVKLKLCLLIVPVAYPQ